jgi:hypothetical protein
VPGIAQNRMDAILVAAPAAVKTVTEVDLTPPWIGKIPDRQDLTGQVVQQPCGTAPPPYIRQYHRRPMRTRSTQKR